MPQNTLDLPENLGARCSLLFVWDEEYTLRALEGYLQFMELKANFEDWDAEQIAPSAVIDLVWQQHLLYNKQYNKACLRYCDNVIGYDPDVMLMADQALQEKKVQTTKIALKALYGRGYDHDVWNFQGSSELLNKKGKVTFNGSNVENPAKDPQHTISIKKATTIRESSSSMSVPAFDTREDHNATGHEPRPIPRDGTVSDSDTSDLRAQSALPLNRAQRENEGNNESVTVKIKCFIDGKTQDTCIRVKRTTKMKKVEDCLAKLMNLESADAIRFLVDGEQVSPWETLESMNVEDPEQHWFTVMPKVGYQ